MSTTPTEVLQTTLATQPAMAVDPTAATEAALDMESIKELMDGFDPAALLPEMDSIFGLVETVCRVAVLIGPILLLVLGLAYLFFAPKEANYYFGYRCYFGMGSVDAWRFTQRLAGIALGGLGLVLTGVMLILSAGFGAMAADAMVWKAFWCLVWEGALALIANVLIWVVTMIRYDARGELRSGRGKPIRLFR